MTEITLLQRGRVGHITLKRPQALNAVTYDMITGIEAALETWARNEHVAMVLIDAEGERAFSAGGDLQLMYRTAGNGDFETGRRFWQDEYRLNARIANFPKPYVALMQGFIMGGGVGISCHGSHRVVGETSRIAMPECAVGLVPDVGGSLLLARAPGRLGEYLGMTGTRMGPGDAIHAGFADSFVPEERWPALKARLIETANPNEIEDFAAPPPPEAPLAALQETIDTHFDRADAAAILAGLPEDEFGREAAALIRKGSPLSVACTVELVRAARASRDIRKALAAEYRFTSRSASDGDFLEGIRAAIIDKDGAPRWQHKSVEAVPAEAVAAMLAPLGEGELTF